jgi:microcystin-dependent protein
MGTPFLGEIRLVSFGFAPKGWALCNGQFLPINQNQALFSILGTTYGGNGQTTFALPDFRGRIPLHVGQHALGERGGSESVTVNISQMPTHIHQLNCSDADGALVPPTNNSWAKTTQNPYVAATAANSVMFPNDIANTGGSQPHTNMQPFIVLNFIIALQGTFPSQN